MCLSKKKKDDCVVYRRKGCSLADGILCKYETCKRRNEAGIHIVEKNLYIPEEEKLFYKN
jgi:hypothetical protein